MVSLKFHDCIIVNDYVEINHLKEYNNLVLLIHNADKQRSTRLYLDRFTAIKLSKELRKQIALLD